MVTEGTARPSTRRYNAKFRQDVRAMPWMTTAFLVAEQRACEACRLASAHYAMAALPPTPVPGCTRARGCGCWFAAVACASQAPSTARHASTGTGRRTNAVGR